MSFYLFLIQPEWPFHRIRRSCYFFAPDTPRVSLLTQNEKSSRHSGGQVFASDLGSSSLSWPSPGTLPQDHWSSATPGSVSVRSPPTSGSWLLPSSLPEVFPLEISMTHFLTSFKVLFKSHLKEVFLFTLFKYIILLSPLPGTLYPAATVIFSSALLLLLLLSRFSRVRLCDPIDGSPPSSPVPGILQARALEWVAISFSILSTIAL